LILTSWVVASPLNPAQKPVCGRGDSNPHGRNHWNLKGSTTVMMGAIKYQEMISDQVLRGSMVWLVLACDTPCRGVPLAIG
jgi:hypothetical protein